MYDFVVITCLCLLLSLDIYSLLLSGKSLPIPDKSILSQYLESKAGSSELVLPEMMPSQHILVATHGGIIHSLLKSLQVGAYGTE